MTHTPHAREQIRSNVDTLAKHTDEEVWTALERVGMAPKLRHVSSKGLATVVESDGTNFSVGASYQPRVCVCVCLCVCVSVCVCVCVCARARACLLLLVSSIRSHATRCTWLNTQASDSCCAWRVACCGPRKC